MNNQRHFQLFYKVNKSNQIDKKKTMHITSSIINFVFMFCVRIQLIYLYILYIRNRVQHTDFIK